MDWNFEFLLLYLACIPVWHHRLWDESVWAFLRLSVSLVAKQLSGKRCKDLTHFEIVFAKDALQYCSVLMHYLLSVYLQVLTTMLCLKNVHILTKFLGNRFNLWHFKVGTRHKIGQHALVTQVVQALEDVATTQLQVWVRQDVGKQVWDLSAGQQVQDQL